MQTNIHPNYQPRTFKCNCGVEYTVRSTLETDYHLDVCANCHPAFTGSAHKKRDTGGQIDSFNNRFKKKKGKIAE